MATRLDMMTSIQFDANQLDAIQADAIQFNVSQFGAIQLEATRDSLPALIGLSSLERLLQSINFLAQIGNAPRHRELIDHQNSPDKHVRCHNAAKMIIWGILMVYQFTVS